MQKGHKTRELGCPWRNLYIFISWRGLIQVRGFIILLYQKIMNRQFNLHQISSFDSNQNREQLNSALITHDKKIIHKNSFFVGEQSNANANTNGFGITQGDEAFPGSYGQNSNNHTINFDKYIRMKGQLQQAKGSGCQNQFNRFGKMSQAQQQINSEQSYTVPLNKKSGKIQIDMTEELTNKVNKKFKQAVNQQIKKQKPAEPLEETAKKQNLKKKAGSNISEDRSINIVKNVKVEAILNKEPMRARYSALLQDHERYQIGFEHRMLIKLLEVMDNTIDYLKSYRNNKSTFLSHLQANFKKNSGPDLTYENMKKLLFLEDSLYELEWALKDSSNKYDLLIRIPSAQKFQERKKRLRMKIVHYLLAKELQHLESQNLKKMYTNKWAEGFDPNNYKIPEKELPIHPLESEISVKNMSQQQISAIPNNHLRDITLNMKKQYQKKCLKSQDVISMIFSKTQKHKFQEKLYASIRQKEKLIKQIKAPVQQITKELLISVLIEIQYIYNSKNVTNIFKSTLQEKLLKSLVKYANESIIKSLQIIIDYKDILFLKQQMTANKTIIVQINRFKHEQLKARIEANY